MEFKDERKGTDAIFADLTPGDVFEYIPGGTCFMKIEEVEKEHSVFNAIYLRDGELEYFNQDDKVTPLVVQLHIIRNE